MEVATDGSARNAEGVVFRRRRADWMADVDAAAAPSGESERRTADARRGALELARATLAAQHGLTAGHSDEVGLLCEEIADELGIEGWERANLLAAAQLHDIGKVAVPDEILDKPGSLSDEEWQLVREHTPVGERIVMAVPELDEVATIVRHSHEHWDGSGYPDGLAGEEIPLASRVVLCVDAFHALRSDRPYRRGRSAQAAIAELRAHAGTQFDPVVVAALEAAAERVRRSGAARFGGSRSLLRSRRVAALLVAMVVSGSALAAIRPDLGDRDHSADARTDVSTCPLDSCPLLEFPSLRPLAARTGARPEASPAIAGGDAPAQVRDTTGHARQDGLRFAGVIEHRPAARRHPRRHHGVGGGGTYIPAAPVAQQAPAAAPPGPTRTEQPAKTEQPTRTEQPARAEQPKRAKPPKRTKPPGPAPVHQAPPPSPPGQQVKSPPPRGNAYGHYKEHGSEGDQHGHD
jgi:hypothetical protein